MAQSLSLDVSVEQLKLVAPFRISGYVFEHVDVAVVRLSDGTHEGRGEAAGVYYLKDDIDHVLAGIESVRAEVEAGASRQELQTLLPPGGARNALDCAYWELEARQVGIPVWKLAGIDAPKPVITTYTLGADDPDKMAQGARDLAAARSLKLKLTGDAELDSARVRAVRAARPDVWIGVDANQGFDRRSLERLMPALLESRVELLEQPVRRGEEAELDGMDRPIPVAADETVQGLSEIAPLVGRFDVVNIKLDKCGGLTEALAMAAESRRLGLKVMVGNMVGSTWAMGPAFVVGQLCDFVDIDGAMFITEDRTPSIVYADGMAWSPEHAWGGPAA